MYDVHLNCATCEIAFCIPKDMEQRRREDHKEFYCPNGHRNYFKSESEKERQIRTLTARVGQLEDQVAYRDRRISTLRGEVRSERARMAARVRWARRDVA